jgi:hypothetical protein
MKLVERLMGWILVLAALPVAAARADEAATVRN